MAVSHIVARRLGRRNRVPDVSPYSVAAGFRVQSESSQLFAARKLLGSGLSRQAAFGRQLPVLAFAMRLKKFSRAGEVTTDGQVMRW